MLGAIKNRLSEFSAFKEGLISCISDTGEKGMQASPQKHMAKKIRLTQIEEEIEELLSKVSEASGVLMKYIDEKYHNQTQNEKPCRKKSLRQTSQTQRAD